MGRGLKKPPKKVLLKLSILQVLAIKKELRVLAFAAAADRSHHCFKHFHGIWIPMAS